jgi:hypothetical protein
MNLVRRGLPSGVVAAVLAALIATAAGNALLRTVADRQASTVAGQEAVADTSLPALAPPPETRCPSAGPVQVGRSRPVHQMVLTTDDGVQLAAIAVGYGDRGVVLVHDDRGDLCEWWRFAARLADQGLRVLAFDLRCYGYSECGRERDYAADAAAAVDALRELGVQRIVVVGAATGAATALSMADHDGVSGVVALNGEAPRPTLVTPVLVRQLGDSGTDLTERTLGRDVTEFILARTAAA